MLEKTLDSSLFVKRPEGFSSDTLLGKIIYNKIDGESNNEFNFRVRAFDKDLACPGPYSPELSLDKLIPETPYYCPELAFTGMNVILLGLFVSLLN